jgi:hypothetical protein
VSHVDASIGPVGNRWTEARECTNCSDSNTFSRRTHLGLQSTAAVEKRRYDRLLMDCSSYAACALQALSAIRQ